MNFVLKQSRHFLFLLSAAIASLVTVASHAPAADLPVKAPVPFVLATSGSGWYKGLGTFAELNDTTTSLGNFNTTGGALNAVLGYQWKVSANGGWMALEVSGAYHNVGGSNLDGALTSRWSSDQFLKFGGPITNILNWMPAGAAFPVIPGAGAATGPAHVWIGIGNRVQDATGTAFSASKHNVDDKFLVGTGVIQQYCTAANSCLALDTYFKFAPSQSGFSVLGTQQNIGKQYTVGVNFIW